MSTPQVIKSLTGDMCHPCIGAVIIRENQILMVERKKFPPGWACVAGHIDDDDPSPEFALEREVKEESGLDLVNYKLLFEEEINNPCRVQVHYHYWYVYRCEATGTLVRQKEELKDLRWVDIDKIHNLKLEEVWKYIFEKIGL